jgi:crotonobetainyl-CoA:carnitine CoA-transferase CaiB-like acyl-CoA transferase
MAARLLTVAGVPAARLADARTLHKHPLLQQRHLYDTVDRPVVGTLHVPGLPCRWRVVERRTRTRSSLLGEHNRAVLGGLLGVSDEELARLEAAGVVGTQPPSG